MKPLLMVVFLLVQSCFSLVLAQTKQKMKWIVQPQVQVINGNENVSSAVSLSTGFLRNNHQLTMGLGIDYYFFRTVPIQTTYQYYLGKKENKPFVYASLGYSIAWATQEQKYTDARWGWWNSETTTAVYNNGYVYAFGLGYSLKMNRQHHLNFSIGYDVKTIHELYDEQVFNGTTTIQLPRKKEYMFRRLAFGLSYQF